MAKHWVTKIDITQIFFDKIVQNFQDMRKIDVRKGIRSFASISVTKRKLFTKNRGGVGSDPPPPGGRGLKELSNALFHGAVGLLVPDYAPFVEKYWNWQHLTFHDFW